MKIALYLGSFNPFHNGHLNVVISALKDFKMDKVVIVPTMQNPWKKDKPIPLDRRFQIIYRSLNEIIGKSHPRYTCGVSPLLEWVEISRIEKEMIPPYYSYATLHALKTKYCNDELYILCGEDTIKSIPDWMHGGKIIEDYDFLVVDRPENTISSTEIRKRIKKGEDYGRLVSPYAYELISKYYK